MNLQLSMTCEIILDWISKECSNFKAPMSELKERTNSGVRFLKNVTGMLSNNISSFEISEDDKDKIF
jgi:hypothetical protein